MLFAKLTWSMTFLTVCSQLIVSSIIFAVALSHPATPDHIESDVVSVAWDLSDLPTELV